MIQIDKLDFGDERFRSILTRGESMDAEVGDRVREIVNAVRERGDEAVFELAQTIDKVSLTSETILVDENEYAEAQKAVADDFLTAVALARVNIRRFHEYQRRLGYVHDDGDGVRLSKKVLPLKKVGVYCPAGTAPLFSSMLMNVIPAQVAGVSEIYAAVPPRRDGSIDPHILVVAKLLGVDGVFKMGGAYAVAAFAYGTVTIPRVDKIVGPGNQYVSLAKRQVFGTVGIDSIAGPSEIVVIADRSARASYVAADLLSQVEHGSGYEAGIVLTDSRDIAAAVKIEVERQLEKLERRDAIGKALERYGGIFICENLMEAMKASNLIAPEHLELMVEEPEPLLAEVENAGAVFVGACSPEPVGDYFAGTNHVLPTGGAARFSSSLSVYDFVKDISIIDYSCERLRRTGRHIIMMAEIEGLTAHANAVRARMDDL